MHPNLNHFEQLLHCFKPKFSIYSSKPFYLIYSLIAYIRTVREKKRLMGVWSGMKQRMKYAEINVEDKLKTVRENCFDAMIIDPTNTGS